MLSPLSGILARIFVKGFYRAHSGMFLFFYVALISYCFYIEVLNKTHLPPHEIILNHLIVVLTVITSPLILIIVCILWLFYTFKTWDYISAQMRTTSNQFLLYSCTSISKGKQFLSWFFVQMLLSLPVIIYACFALIVGIVYNHYLIPMLIMIFIPVIATVSALVNVKRANRFVRDRKAPLLLRLGGRWKKPFYSLYLYEIAQRQKVAFVVTKVLTYLLMICSAYLLADQEDKVIAGGIAALGVVLTHAFLIYNSYRFEAVCLSFSRNFPYSVPRLYSYWLMNYFLLTIPESIWLLSNFQFKTGAILVALNLSTAMFYRNLLYKISLNVIAYLRWVFYSFLLFFLLLLSKLVILVIAINIVLSILVMHTGYYRPKDCVQPR